jgi:AbrB family looped-hinge helix DNA binding protein
MQTATLSTKFQIYIPKKARDELHIEPGKKFIFIVKGDCLELVPKRDIKAMRGLLKGANIKNTRDRSDRLSKH